MTETDGRKIYDKALAFATAAHSTQKRKYTGEPYINHCIEVAETVLKFTGDYNIASAALMHDVIEDTAITEPEMRAEFGDDITDLVLCVTDVLKPEDGNRTIRKEKDLEHLTHCSPRAANIKYADMMSNTVSIAKNDKDFAKIYMKEIWKIFNALEGKGNPELRKAAEKTLVSVSS